MRAYRLDVAIVLVTLPVYAKLPVGRQNSVRAPRNGDLQAGSNLAPTASCTRAIA
jgi:hypothetical protein